VKRTFGCCKAIRMSLKAINAVFHTDVLANFPLGNQFCFCWLPMCLFGFLPSRCLLPISTHKKNSTCRNAQLSYKLMPSCFSVAIVIHWVINQS